VLELHREMHAHATRALIFSLQDHCVMFSYAVEVCVSASAHLELFTVALMARSTFLQTYLNWHRAHAAQCTLHVLNAMAQNNSIGILQVSHTNVAAQVMQQQARADRV
jgi:hypothetical protein